MKIIKTINQRYVISNGRKTVRIDVEFYNPYNVSIAFDATIVNSSKTLRWKFFDDLIIEPAKSYWYEFTEEVLRYRINAEYGDLMYIEIAEPEGAPVLEVSEQFQYGIFYPSLSLILPFIGLILGVGTLLVILKKR